MYLEKFDYSVSQGIKLHRCLSRVIALRVSRVTGAKKLVDISEKELRAALFEVYSPQSPLLLLSVLESLKCYSRKDGSFSIDGVLSYVDRFVTIVRQTVNLKL